MTLTRMRYPDHMDDIFDELADLTLVQRHTIKERYRFMMEEYRARCRWYAVLFYTFKITVTVGSLAVPALLSIENNTGASSVPYWFTWGLSLAVTTANGIMTLFKLDKRFFMLHATAERLRSETWQFIQLSGRYSGHHGHHHKKPTHENQFVYYCSQLEKINMKRIDDEYIKGSEEGHPTPGPPIGQKPSSDVTVPSPPDLQTPESIRRRESMSIVEDGEDEEEDKDKGRDRGRDNDKGRDKGRDKDKDKDKGRDKGRDKDKDKDKEAISIAMPLSSLSPQQTIGLTLLSPSSKL